MGRRTVLYAYVGLLVAVAVPLLFLVVRFTAWDQALDDPVVLLVLAVMVVIGEIRPIMISHGDDSVDIVTISCCFSLALTLHGPLAVAVAVQATALLVDDVRCRRGMLKMVFNHANFIVSLGLARWIYSQLSGHALLVGDRDFVSQDVVPALVAAAVFFLVNQGLTTVVICIVAQTPVVPSLRRDLAGHAPTVGVLMALAPVVVQAVSFTPLLVLLLMMPIAAVHTSARLAVERERQALHDSLTGLPNRALFNERASRALADRSGRLLAVMLVDLDHFKEINDTLGHHIGDELLILVGDRIRRAVREEDLVARFGGDEFAILCRGLPGTDLAGELASRVVAAMEETYTIDGVRLDIGASLGFALSPDHGLDAETLLQRADIALYTAKVRRGSWAAYVPEEDGHSVQKLALLGELRHGLGDNQLEVHYQPICDAMSGVVLSVEALVRWQHPVHGLLAPDRFIQVAENTGLIVPLTLAVLDMTLEQLVQWDRCGFVVDASVNLSARHLTDLQLPDQVAAALAASGLAADRLVLEVTESQIVADAGRTEVVLGRLRDMGVRLAVDDFGTGYSSLTQLRSLAVDVLKIDRSFVQDMATDDNDALIVRSTIDLAHNLGLRVVAEGVEDQQALEALRALGCDAVQGFYLSRPLLAAAVVPWARGSGAWPLVSPPSTAPPRDDTPGSGTLPGGVPVSAARPDLLESA